MSEIAGRTNSLHAGTDIIETAKHRRNVGTYALPVQADEQIADEQITEETEASEDVNDTQADAE